MDYLAESSKRTPCYTIPYYRGYYNRGKLIKAQSPRRGPISFRYNDQGERLSFRTDKRLLNEEEYQQTLALYGPDERSTQDFDFSYKLAALPKNKGGRPSYDSFDWCI